MEEIMKNAQTSDALLPSKAVWERYGVCDRTLSRWLADERLNFPPPIIVRKRRYWRMSDLEGFEKMSALAAGGAASYAGVIK
jgi:hypothetical protein